MYIHDMQALAHIASTLREQFGERIVSFYVFGSRARGDHGPRSDFDVLIVVKGKQPELERDIMATLVEEEMKAGMILTPLIKDQKNFDLERSHNSPFYQNIQTEGVAL
jgi:uncharacterized protein